MPQKRDVNRDSMDFRDLIYRPALVRLRDKVLPKWAHLQILDQENEGACTGFGLAAVINYLNWENGEKVRVSQRMLFEMAKRHDQWPGHNYDWSSARGAMKGWHKNGVCPEKVWPYDPQNPGILTEQRQNAALSHRLGAYYRVMPRRSDLHAALNEVSIVFASAATHKGWDEMGKSHIPYDPSWPEDGGHAFAIIGYTNDGFLVQNSWGKRWGNIRIGKRSVKGVAVWSYDDFERNVWDLWVARLARPLDSHASLRTAKYTQSSGGTRLSSSGPERHTIRDHYLHIDDGQYDPKGDYPTLAAEAEDILDRAVNGADGKSPPAHLLLYAHGGLNSIKDSAARVGKWREVFRDNGVHEVHFIWETGMLDELRDVLFGKQRLAQERVGGASDWWDTILEKATHPLGYALWKEMRTDADLAFQDDRAGTHTLATWRAFSASFRRPGVQNCTWPATARAQSGTATCLTAGRLSRVRRSRTWCSLPRLAPTSCSTGTSVPPWPPAGSVSCTTSCSTTRRKRTITWWPSIASRFFTWFPTRTRSTTRSSRSWECRSFSTSCR